jgi:hypothetical protein
MNTLSKLLIYSIHLESPMELWYTPAILRLQSVTVGPKRCYQPRKEAEPVNFPVFNQKVNLNIHDFFLRTLPNLTLFL